MCGGKHMESIDKAIQGMVSKYHRAVMKMNAQVTSRIRDPEAEPTIGG